MLDFERSSVLSELQDLGLINISSIEYNSDSDEFLVMSNSPGGQGARYSPTMEKIADVSISINNADSEDLTHLSGDNYAYCSEGNTIEEFNAVTGARFGKYILPPRSASNKGFECLAYDAGANVYYVGQEANPMIVYVVPKNPSNTKATYDLRTGGYAILFDAEEKLGPYTDHIGGMTFNPTTNTLYFICQIGGVDGHGRIIETNLLGDVIDTFDDLPGPNYEGVTIGPGGSLQLVSEPNLWLTLLPSQPVEEPAKGIVSSETVLKGVQKNGYKTIQHKFTDHLGKVHVTHSRHVDPTFDIDADRVRRQTKINKILRQEENDKKLELTKKGSDAFTSSEYQDRDDSIKYALKELLRMDRAEAAKYSQIVNLLGAVSDEKLLSMLEVNQAKVDEIREWQTDLTTIRALLNKGAVING